MWLWEINSTIFGDICWQVAWRHSMVGLNAVFLVRIFVMSVLYLAHWEILIMKDGVIGAKVM